MDAPDVWVARDDGSEIIRAREIAAVSLDYDGNVTARLAGGEVAMVTLVSGRSYRDEHRPDDLHRQLLHAITHLSDSSQACLLRPVHDEPHGWRWISEPL